MGQLGISLSKNPEAEMRVRLLLMELEALKRLLDHQE
jgi:hypothetical protein